MTFLGLIKVAVAVAGGMVVGVMMKKRDTQRNKEAQSILEEKNLLISRLQERIKETESEMEELRKEIESISSEKDCLLADNQRLSNEVENLMVRVEKAGYLENASRGLVAWIQSVIGYAENKNLFHTDADELAQFRADARELPILLQLNGIECNSNPPDEGIGFVHMRDDRIAEGKECVICEPMLLRDGVIVARGIIRVPDVDKTQQEFSNESADSYVSNTMNDQSIISSNAEPDTTQPIPDSLSKPDVDYSDNVREIPSVTLSTQSLVNQPEEEKTDQGKIRSGGGTSPWDFDF